MNERDPVAERQAELRRRVGEHLDADETVQAALWIARASGLPLIAKVTRAPQSVLGFGGMDLSGNPHTGLNGPATSTAAALQRHLPDHTTAAALALTSARLLLLVLTDPSPPEPAPRPASVPASGLASGPGSGPASGPGSGPGSGLGPGPELETETAAEQEAQPRGLLDRVRRASRRMFERAEPEPLPPLEPVWHCPREKVAAVEVSDPDGELILRFTDGSSMTVVAPAMLAAPFAEAARRA